MNITKLVDLHLYNYLVYNGLLSSNPFSVLQKQIDEGQDLQDRKNMEGHVTGSFMLLNPAKTHILMIHHIGLNKWLCPGGHYEGDVTIRVSALRELTEETGFPSEMVDYISDTGYLALDIDSHLIPARPAKGEGEHYHHDFLYVGIAKQEFEPIPQEEEVLEAKWVALEDAAQLPDERVRRAVMKARKILGAEEVSS